MYNNIVIRLLAYAMFDLRLACGYNLVPRLCSAAFFIPFINTTPCFSYCKRQKLGWRPGNVTSVHVVASSCTFAICSPVYRHEGMKHCVINPSRVGEIQ